MFIQQCPSLMLALGFRSIKCLSGSASSIWFLIAAVFMASAGVNAEPTTRLLVLGNSMTLHTPNAGLGWAGNWGMAASRQEKDFSNVLATMLQKVQHGERPVLYPKNVSDFERGVDAFDFGRLKFVEDFQPDAVVIFLGDNVKLEEFGAHAFERQYDKLLAALTGDSTRRLYCVSTWWTNKKLDALISAACRSRRGRFVDIQGLNGLPGMTAVTSGQFSNAGVAAHPGDAGMEAIAKRIFSSIRGAQQ